MCVLVYQFRRVDPSEFPLATTLFQKPAVSSTSLDSPPTHLARQRVDRAKEILPLSAARQNIRQERSSKAGLYANSLNELNNKTTVKLSHSKATVNCHSITGHTRDCHEGLLLFKVAALQPGLAACDSIFSRKATFRLRPSFTTKFVSQSPHVITHLATDCPALAS